MFFVFFVAIRVLCGSEFPVRSHLHELGGEAHLHVLRIAECLVAGEGDADRVLGLRALAEQAGKKGTMKSRDPIEDRSLFGR